MNQINFKHIPAKAGICFYVIYTLIIINTTSSQNLVPNPSFEFHIICPYSDGNDMPTLLNNPPWQSTLPQGGSTDTWDTCIYSNCNCGSANCNYIYSFLGKQNPRSGSGMAGFYLHDVLDTLDTEYDKEYAQVKLKHVLEQNKRYWVSFYISLHEYSPAGIDKFQAYFSDTLVMFEPTDPPSWTWLPSHYMFHPQVSNPDYNIITDTINWIKIEGRFIATGTEQYMILGNFTPTYLTHSIKLKDVVPSPYFPWCYYFLDDIAVYPDSTPVYPASLGNDTCIYASDTLTLGFPSRAEYLYQWYDGNGNLLDTTGSITVSPTQTTSYILVQKDFRFEETRDTIKVTVGNCIPIPDYSHFNFEIYPNPCNGIVNVRFNTKVPEGTVLELYDMIGQEVAQYPLAGTENIATANLENLATAIYYATVVVPDGFQKSVKLVVMR